ncbi:MAG TPA: hypothetical protein VGO47_04925 [Chlamydiales bacterium]|jgi:hypothetical protein|nr:hypothetical protein [Chlamydiales bacterium]
MDLVLGVTTVRPETVALALQLIGTSYPNLLSLRLCPRSLGTSRLQASDIYALLKDAHWPKVKSLELIVYINNFDEASIDARPWKDICRSFFRRHPLIDSLTLSPIPPSTALLGESTNELLSNLKTFDIHGKLSEAFSVSALPRSLQPGSETPRGLVSLSCSISSQCIAVLEGLPNLRLLAAKLEERGNDTLRAMLEVLGRTTHLERLDIEPPYTWSSQWEPQEVTFFIYVLCFAA